MIVSKGQFCGNAARRTVGLERTVWALGRCLDERDFDGLRQLFTADATVTTRGTASGHDALVEQARRRHSRDDGRLSSTEHQELAQLRRESRRLRLLPSLKVLDAMLARWIEALGGD